MKRMTSMFTMSALVLLIAGVACRYSQNATADSSLSRDLALAAHQRDSLDSVSTLESGRLPATAPAAYRTTRARSGYRSGTASGEVSRTRTVTTSSSGTEVKHTKRDAAIGAATGAVIGATTSRNKVKGGVIGAAVGGILGAVIGNNVDKTKKKP
jgi:hypothetical protein